MHLADCHPGLVEQGQKVEGGMQKALLAWLFAGLL